MIKMFLNERARKFRREFTGILTSRGVNFELYYPSKHFFERIVERNLDNYDTQFNLLMGLCKAIHYMQQTTFNATNMKYVHNKFVAVFAIREFRGNRVVVMKTVYPMDNPKIYYDVDLTKWN